MPKCKDIGWLHELASLRGGRCLSVEYINNQTKYEWECDKGHRWWAVAGSIQQGHWCPECYYNKRRIGEGVESLRKLAMGMGGECLSSKYEGVMAIYEWRCKDGHLWSAKANTIQQGHWCPKCANKKRVVGRRKDIKWLHELASLRGGKCLSTEYINSETKYGWECGKCGHKWRAKASTIGEGCWCPECFGKKRKNINYLYKLALQRGERCLSTEYIDSKTKYEWECGEGHVFKMSANSVQQGQRCPHCSHCHSKSELQIYEFVKQLFPDALNGQRKLLINPKFELDIYLPSLRKAIEFDGKYWHSHPEAQERDLRKNQECEAKGIKLLRILEQDFLDNPQQVFEKIKEFLKS